MSEPFYQDDYVTLYHGDCLEHPEWWTDADVLVTDPPYGIWWTQPDLPNTQAGKRGKLGSLHKNLGIRGDENTEVRDCALTLWREKPGIVFSAWRELVPGARQILTWKKPPTTGVIGATYGYRKDTEAICLLGQLPKRPVQRSSVLETHGSNTGYQDGSHPHMKPVALMEMLIEWTEGVVADPFAGSGSTLVAAKLLGRRAVGVELEEKYCEIAARRLSQGVLDFGDWKGNA